MAITSVRKTSIILDEFTSSGIWYKPSGAVQVTVEVVGGGGGGAGGAWTTATTSGQSPWLGGQGGESYYGTFVDPDALPETVAILIGNGGTGGAAPATIDNNPSAGGAGTSTSFGNILVAGGAGGTSSSPAAAQRNWPFVWPYVATGYPALPPSVAVAVRAVLAMEAQLPQPLEPLALLGLEAVVALPQTRALRG